MPKANPDKQKTKETEVDRQRKSALQRFFGLTEKALQHIEDSLDANQPCVCRMQAPSCLLCGGKGYRPDTDQRNWAVEQVVDRVAPKPKAVEVGPDKTQERTDIENQVKGLPDDELDKQLQMMGVKIAVVGE